MRLEYSIKLDDIEVPRFSVEAVEGIGMAYLALRVPQARKRGVAPAVLVVTLGAAKRGAALVRVREAGHKQRQRDSAGRIGCIDSRRMFLQEGRRQTVGKPRASSQDVAAQTALARLAAR